MSDPSHIVNGLFFKFKNCLVKQCKSIVSIFGVITFLPSTVLYLCTLCFAGSAGNNAL